MAYATISTWKLSEPAQADDSLWQVMQDKYVPWNRELGAIQTLMIPTAPDETAIVSLFPDKATRDAAQARIAALRQEGGSEFESRMLGEVSGEVRAASL